MNIGIGTPQIILLVLVIMSLGMSLAKHGELDVSRYSFWRSLLSNAILIALLYWGGFFK